MGEKTSLLDIINQFQDARGELQSRVVRYAADGTTPVVIETSRVDDEGTVWLTQRNLETGETHLRQIPEDR